ncbi:nuclear transport factor 2 family protein [Brachybacterium paraconglomeratum]|uniref:nuclear transport factor 2 family protein n=1 Tax=Brachybacterium paraconglomeratum TaxID=173362 RepID=UPI0022E7327F|nr:nuclear transport factor 2 family protein [Brachybacterium paraconglomeratum]
MSAATLQDLLDRAGIDDAINAYSHALDQRDWSILPEAFTPDAEIVLIDREKVLDPRSLVELLSGNDATRLGGQHLVGKTRYRIAGDRAHTVTEALWTTLQTTEEEGTYLLIRGTGIYVDDLVRGEDGWRIARRELALKSITRDRVPMEAADVADIRHTLEKDSWY